MTSAWTSGPEPSTETEVPDTVEAMKRRDRTTDSLPVALRKLIAEGKATPPERVLGDVLAQIGRPPGDVTDAGTRALAEQRGDRV